MPLNPSLKAQWKERSVNILFKKTPTQTQSSEIFPLSPSLVSHTDMTTAEGNIKTENLPGELLKATIQLKQPAKEFTKIKIHTQNTSE